MAGVTFKVERLQVVTRALEAADAQMRSEGHQELVNIGGLVETAAEVKARAILHRGKTKDWGAMRTGVTPNVVYVVPQQRGSKDPRRKRKGFAYYVKTKAMTPALDEKRPEALRRYRALTARVCRAFNG